jgi:hypothetical protein
VSEEDARTVDERPGGRTSAPAATPASPASSADPDDRYRRGAEIARGGMGRVVEAEDVLLGRTVALKETLELDEDARMRFEREVRITARLEHPSIVPVYDAGRTPEGLPFYVMRRLSGRPLDQVVRAAAGLDERLTLLPNLLAVFDALAHAHRRGVIHRDLKPGNVLVGDLGETIVIDWGLAKVLGEAEPAITAPVAALEGTRTGASDATVAGAVVGTPGFMAPEQVIADAVDARSDVYALGATLYYLLAGTAPHAGGSTTEILDRTVAEPPRPLPEVAPGVPPDLVTIVDKAMAAEPAARYPDAAAMGEDLRRFLAGQLVAAHHYSSRQRLARFVRRYRAVLAAVALALVAIAVIATLSLRRILADRDRIAEARAAAEARARDLRRHNDGLIVEQAASYLATDPSLAIATLRRLPDDSEQWAAARNIAAEATTRGITYALPGHEGTVSALSIAPDGARAVSYGIEGIALVHDLVARTSRVLERTDGGATRTYDWAGDRIVRLAFATQALDLLDPATGAVVESLSSRAIHLDTSWAGGLAWLEEDGSVHRRSPTGVREAVGRFPGAVTIVLGPSGEALVVGAQAGASHVVVRRPEGWRVALRPAKGVATAALSADGARVALADANRVVEYDLEATPPAELRRIPGTVTFVSYAGDVLYSLRLEGQTRRWYDHSRSPARVLANVEIGIAGKIPVIADGVFAFMGSQPAARVVLTFPGRTIRLAAIDPVRRLATRPGTGVMLGATAGRILVWDLDEVAPAHIHLAVSPTTIANLGDHHMLFASAVIGHYLDLREDVFHEAPALALAAGVGINREAGVIATPFPDHVRVVTVEPWAVRTIPTARTFGYASARDADSVIAATADGELVELAGTPGAERVLGRLGSPTTGSTGRGRWVLVSGERSLARIGGGLEVEDLGSPIDSADITADGTVHALAGDRLLRWPPGERPTTLATTPVELHGVVSTTPERIFALGPDQALWRFDGAAGFTQIVPALSAPPFHSADGRCSVGVRDGSVVVADDATRTWWSFGAGTFVVAAPSPGCDVIYAFTAQQALERWQIPVPWDLAELRRWVATRTNATASTTRGVIEWALPPL